MNKMNEDVRREQMALWNSFLRSAIHLELNLYFLVLV